jgi:hypothetical protein
MEPVASSPSHLIRALLITIAIVIGAISVGLVLGELTHDEESCGGG